MPGRFLVEHAVAAAPLSQGDIRQPRVTDTRTGAVLLDLWKASTWDFDGDVTESTDSTVTLHVRRWPGSASCTLVVDADARTYALRDVVRERRLAPLLERLRFAGLARA